MLVHTRCPIDGTDDADVEICPATFDPGQLTADVFSARRRPDGLHYRMVRNRRSGCVRADPILDSPTLERLYRRSRVTCADAGHAVATYMEYAEAVWPLLPDRRGVLEVGCAEGLFLARFLAKGFRLVAGVEPGEVAHARADPTVAGNIHQGTLAPGLFRPATFSLVCGFQVLDHVPDPNGLLRTCRELLVPGGVMYWICHDVGSPVARVLGPRSPIFDVEHVVLYDRSTLRRLFENNGYEVLDVFSVSNSYPLSYWTHLAPLPSAWKDAAMALLGTTGLGRLKLRVGAGNVGIIARKPIQAGAGP